MEKGTGEEMQGDEIEKNERGRKREEETREIPLVSLEKSQATIGHQGKTRR